MCHFEIFGDVFGIDAKGAVIEGGDHFLFFELVIQALFAVPVVGFRIQEERLQR